MGRRNYDPETYPSADERLQAVTDLLEAGVSEVFQSGKFEEYLCTLSKFHHYSANNVVLIAMQCPTASFVAGYSDWKRKFNRHVRAKETGIRILAPCSFAAALEVERLDPVTKRPILDEKGNPVTERVLSDPKRFKVATVFDISQTDGEELPKVAKEITAAVERYEEISTALERLSPYAIQFEDFPGEKQGRCDYTSNLITIKSGMSEAQTLKTMIHEIAHAKLHSDPIGDGFMGDTLLPERRIREVQAESVAFVVCQHFGIDTSGYSFGYVSEWSQGKEMNELKSSLNVIRDTAAEIIEGIEGPELDQQRQHHPRKATHRIPAKKKQRQTVR